MEQWWVVTLECEDAEDMGCCLVEVGAGGSEIISNTELKCFVQGDVETFCKESVKLGAKVINYEKVPDTNWVQKCEEVWEPLKIGSFEIIPVMSLEEDNIPTPEPNKLYIIPGAGFGTGHHGTTSQVITLLNELDIAPQTVLDVGTGSGILAIAAYKLFGVEIDAFDNDPDSINNAIENAKLNSCSDKIRYKITGKFEYNEKKFDVVLANLYAELLEKFYDDITAHTEKGGYLVISGFKSADNPCLARYNEPDWKRIKTSRKDEWEAVLLKKL